LQTIADGLPALISYIDAAEAYRFVNRAYEDWFGIKCREIIGRTKCELLGEETYAVAKPSIDRVLQGETVMHERAWLRNGKTFYLHCDYVPHFGDDRKVQG